MSQANPFFDVKSNPFLNPEQNPFLDPQKNPFMSGDFAKMMAPFKAAEMDFDAIMGTQRKNLEAVAEANKKAFEGMQAAMTRQAEIVREALKESNASLKALSEAKEPGEQAAKQAELAKDALEHAVSNTREMSDLMMKSQRAALDVLNKRMVASLDEFKGYVGNGK